ncbi:MAG TPA: hypothetical protein VD969_26065 [Symbiobacteriaceae bacterium]|nr:hypothetical protein [Symbiobacteriaceae bacterium]
MLRFGAPLPVVPAQVLVEVPERQLTFEATVQPVVGESEIRLSYPLWLVGPRECCGKVAKVDLHLRYAESGTARWHSGRSVEIADQAVSFLGEDQLAEGTRVDLLIRVSLQPLPMHAIGRVLRSVPTSLGTMIDVLPVACSFQTEHAVASALGRPLLPNRLAEEGECQCGVISPRMFSLIY